MRLVVIFAALAGVQLAAAIKPPGFPHGPPNRPFHPHHRSPLPPGPPYRRYPSAGPHRGFHPRPYGPGPQIRPHGLPYRPHPPPPSHTPPRLAVSTTTAAPSLATEPETVAPSLTAVTTASAEATALETGTESSVYFPTAVHTAGTTDGGVESTEVVVEPPPTTESKSESVELESESKDVPKPSPSLRRVPHPAVRPQYRHPRPKPAHPHHPPFSGGYRSPPPSFHHRPGPYPPRGHSRPKTYYASGKRPSPSTTPVIPVTPEPELPVTEQAQAPTQPSEVQISQQPTSAEYSRITTPATTAPTSTASPYTSPPASTQPPTTTAERETSTTVYSEPASVAARTVPSHPTPTRAVPSRPQSSRPAYQLSFGSADDAEDSSIPGVAGVDYPTLTEVPDTGFTCDDKIPGYYADQEASCQVWHYCGQGVSRQSFLCPVGTVYSQLTRVCDWWFNVNCAAAESQYDVNADLYQPAAAGSAVYGQRRSAGAGAARPPLAPQPYSQGPLPYHALPQAGVEQ